MSGELDGLIQEAYLRLMPQLKAIFKKYDIDGNGEISKAEFCRIGDEMLRGCDAKLSNRQVATQIKERFKSMDRNKDQSIGWNGNEFPNIFQGKGSLFNAFIGLVEFWDFFAGASSLPTAETWDSDVLYIQSWGVDTSEFEVEVHDILSRAKSKSIQKYYLSLRPKLEEFFSSLDTVGEGFVQTEDLIYRVREFFKAGYHTNSEEDVEKKIKLALDRIPVQSKIDWNVFWDLISTAPFLPEFPSWENSIKSLKAWGIDVSSDLDDELMPRA